MAGPARRTRRCCDRSTPSPDGSHRHATRRRQGSSSSALCKSTSLIASAASVAAAMCWRARSRRPIDASIHPASSSALARSRVGAVSPAASSAVRIRCAPLLSPKTTQAQPNPLTSLEREQRLVHRAPRQRGVEVGTLGPGKMEMFGLTTAAHTVCGRFGGGGEPCAVGGAGALGHSGVGHRSERERPDAVEQSVANASPRRPRHRRPTRTGSRAVRRVSIAAPAGTSSASSTDSTAGNGAPPANVASAHRPRWSSGKSSS